MFLQIENLGDERYSTALGYPGMPRAVYRGYPLQHRPLIPPVMGSRHVLSNVHHLLNWTGDVPIE